jgi:hypothetical protein
MQYRVFSIALLTAAFLTACGGGTSSVPQAQTTPTPVPTSSSSNNVPVPLSGAYLGAVDNVQGNNQQEQQLETLEAQAGKRFAIQLTYAGWGTLNASYVATSAELQGDVTYDRIPNISWTCGDDLNNIAQAGPGSTGQLLADYQTIKTAADALKGYGHPVLLRFFHEFNLDVNGATTNGDAPNCFNQNDTMAVKAQKFVAAWENIYAIFRQEGATNVSFEWCPTDVGGGPVQTYAEMDMFLPTHVDWIGFDRYDRDSIGFKAMIANFYGHYAPLGKPLILSETGEIPSGNPSSLPNWNPSWSQAQFFSDVQTYMPTAYPQLKAINYFDSAGAVIWYLDSGGTTGITNALRDAYFISLPYPDGET